VIALKFEDILISLQNNPKMTLIARSKFNSSFSHYDKMSKKTISAQGAGDMTMLINHIQTT